MPDLNTQKTNSPGLSVAQRTYYEKKLLFGIKERMKYYQFADKRVLPKNSGTTISFQKFTELDEITTALAESVVPDGQTLTMSEVLAVIAEYGGYASISSLLKNTNPVKLMKRCAGIMSRQAARSADALIRDVVHAGTNVMYSDSLTGRHQITAANTMSVDEILKAARTLDDNEVAPIIRNGQEYYVCIGDAFAKYDLLNDTDWKDAAKYAGSTQIFNGEIGTYGGVIFVLSSKKHRFSAEDLIAAGSTNEARTIDAKATAAYTSGTKTLLVASALTAAEATALVGREIIVNGHHDIVAEANEGAADAASIVLTNGYTGTDTDLNGKTIYPGEAGAQGMPVTSTVIFGDEAYAAVDLGLNRLNSQKDAKNAVKNARLIVKGLGEGGSADPLDQIATAGWKFEGFSTTILNQENLIRIEHGVTA